jgi:hypothetical protein
MIKEIFDTITYGGAWLFWAIADIVGPLIVLFFIGFFMWCIIQYIAIANVMFWVLCKNVYVKSDYRAKNGIQFWNAFKMCFSLPYCIEVSDSKVTHKFIYDVPADTYMVVFDFTGRLPKWKVHPRIKPDSDPDQQKEVTDLETELTTSEWTLRS